MQKSKNRFGAAGPNHAKFASKKLRGRKSPLAEMPWNANSNLWPLIILVGLLLAVILMHWLKMSN